MPSDSAPVPGATDGKHGPKTFWFREERDVLLESCGREGRLNTLK